MDRKCGYEVLRLGLSGVGSPGWVEDWQGGVRWAIYFQVFNQSQSRKLHFLSSLLLRVSGPLPMCSRSCKSPPPHPMSGRTGEPHGLSLTFPLSGGSGDTGQRGAEQGPSRALNPSHVLLSMEPLPLPEVSGQFQP